MIVDNKNDIPKERHIFAQVDDNDNDIDEINVKIN
jgi:hypothetical protein